MLERMRLSDEALANRLMEGDAAHLAMTGGPPPPQDNRCALNGYRGRIPPPLLPNTRRCLCSVPTALARAPFRRAQRRRGVCVVPVPLAPGLGAPLAACPAGALRRLVRCETATPWAAAAGARQVAPLQRSGSLPVSALCLRGVQSALAPASRSPAPRSACLSGAAPDTLGALHARLASALLAVDAALGDARGRPEAREAT